MKYHAIHVCPLSILALIVFVAGGCASTPTQTSFASPEDAVTAVVNAARTNDKPKLESIFGAGAAEILSSGDEVADHNMADKFVALYDEKHQLTSNDDGSKTLVVGDNDWPLPIPIVKDTKKNNWLFDTAAGKDEILNRRIGRNELFTIEVCRAIVDAQKDYARMDPNGDGVPEYADKFLSDPGKKNGLYWKTDEGEPPSPLGPLVADASAEGYKRSDDNEPVPYHGYCYRILKSQGSNAPGGAYDYVIDGKMIGGFAVIAYPAQYGNSGIMTFIVSLAGDVYQQDLGANAADVAKEMSAFDPGPGWDKVE